MYHPRASMRTLRKILILGAGELGVAVAESLVRHHSFDPTTTSLSLTVRPEMIAVLNANTTSDRVRALTSLRNRTGNVIAYTGADLVVDSEASLAALFRNFSCVVHAGAMALPEGTQLKVTRAALAAGVDEYVPWQWGVNYDAIGKEGGLGLFSEQCEVRDLLRAQSRTKWFILSCGIFMSFLFEDFWGVVLRTAESDIRGVRALGGWDHLVTVTTVEDIARCNAELILRDVQQRDKAVYIAGDTMRYDEFADLVERVVGRSIERELWTTAFLIQESEKEPENKLWKYRVVFSEGVGLAWPKEETYNAMNHIEMENIEQYMRRMQMR